MTSRILVLLLPLLLAACASSQHSPAPVGHSGADKSTTIAVSPALTSGQSAPSGKRGGGYYLDDGPGDTIPPDLERIPNAQPINEPPHRFANKPYNVFGLDYQPLPANKPYQARGIASWYGRKFHGQKTSSGERYDMYGMTAAHPTLPIPSYVRVTNPANGKSVVVRVNDRGPFHSKRIIDLSYTAAWKLDYIKQGSTLVEVERVWPDDTGPVIVVAQDNTPPVRDPNANTASSTLATPRDASGTWLQLGAFGTRENADNFLAHISRDLAREPVPSFVPGSAPSSAPTTAGVEGEMLDSRLVIKSSGLWHRVRLGPWPSAEAARAVAERLSAIVGSPPIIISH
jgi:rare lipoprotein A